MGFSKDLGLGKFGERTLQEVLVKHGLTCEKNTSDDEGLLSQFDLKVEMPYGPIYFEVKFDRMERRTGNVALEYHNTKKNKPSGILGTTCHIWCFVLSDKSVWIAGLKEIKDYIKKHNPLKDVEGGDDNSQMLIYPRQHIFDEIFYRIDNVGETTLNVILAKLRRSNTEVSNESH